MTEPGSIQRAIEIFGARVFAELGEQRPSTFSKDGITGRIMEWSINSPEVKERLFTLVDVLPSLRSSAAIAEHVTEYLGPVAHHLGPLAHWIVSPKPNSLRAGLTAFAVQRGVREMARQFIAGNSPQGALKELRRIRAEGLAFTVDLLGEYCVSEKEACEYLGRYRQLLETLGSHVPHWHESRPLLAGHVGDASPICVSVKLSALYSQAHILNFDRSVAVLSERLLELVRAARSSGAMLYVDAEDTGHNPLIYQTFINVFGAAESRDFPYPGIVVQAYDTKSEPLVHDLLAFADRRGAPIAIRLVKGAYWDTETALCRQNHWPQRLFQEKEATDAHYEHLSRILIDHHHLCLPAFGSHNIRSLSHAICYAESKGLSTNDYELQMLYGMAEPIAKSFRNLEHLVRLYVPVGEMIPGMGYLVRRLLENTSNESFLRHTFSEQDHRNGQGCSTIRSDTGYNRSGNNRFGNNRLLVEPGSMSGKSC